MFLKRNYIRVIGAEVRDSCGSSGTGETPQAFTPRRLTARPAESEHLEGKSTTPHYLVNSNKVCENSQKIRVNEAHGQENWHFANSIRLW
ncbi:hypothetical protein ACQKOM_08135 [Peribacillus frigoritolerans]|uniref:hypothetical protein n=1 Tax=Peribacillus frigoritolerans TaxID=450367 RepID=UPI003D005BB2